MGVLSGEGLRERSRTHHGGSKQSGICRDAEQRERLSDCGVQEPCKARPHHDPLGCCSVSNHRSKTIETCHAAIAGLKNEGRRFQRLFIEGRRLVSEMSG